MPLYWSTAEANGKTQDYLLQPVADATYVINFAMLKTHERNGITLRPRTISARSSAPRPARKPATATTTTCTTGCPGDRSNDGQIDQHGPLPPLVDLNGHAGMGGKTLLYMVDGIFGGKNWNGEPSKWALAPFNNAGPPASSCRWTRSPSTRWPSTSSASSGPTRPSQRRHPGLPARDGPGRQPALGHLLRPRA